MATLFKYTGKKYPQKLYLISCIVRPYFSGSKYQAINYNTKELISIKKIDLKDFKEIAQVHHDLS